jgi:cell division septation protein DedD
VSVIVLLLAGAGIGGYLYGVKAANEKPEQAFLDAPDINPFSDSAPAHSETPAPVTFYTVLTESKEDKPVPVLPQKPPEDQREELKKQTPPEGGLSLMLQVASYRGREAASGLLEKMSGEGYSGTIEVADLGERGTWYRVRIGPYGSESEANRVLEKLRKERGLKGYIVR